MDQADIDQCVNLSKVTPFTCATEFCFKKIGMRALGNLKHTKDIRYTLKQTIFVSLIEPLTKTAYKTV